MNIYIRPCTELQLTEIMEIFNEVILNSTALYEYEPRNSDFMKLWYETKLSNHNPIIGAFDTNNKLLGFSSYGPFRPQPAYKYTAEHSVYIKADAQKKGLGKILLNAIINAAKENNIHTLIGVIDTENKASINLHKKAGFILCGVINEAGYKFNKWLNTAIYQLPLTTNDKNQHPTKNSN